MLKFLLLTVVCSQLIVSALFGAESSLSRNFWDADSIEWGDGRPYEKPVKKEGPYPTGFKADFQMDIPASGWYEVIFPASGSEWRHDLLLDGESVWRFRTTSLITKGSMDAKAGNIWLKAGKHILRVQRLGRNAFPTRMIGGILLRPAEGRPEVSITAEKTLVDVVRAGEVLEIKVTGGGLKNNVTYELLRSDLHDQSAKTDVVSEVSFVASEPLTTKLIKIQCPAEGAFKLSARVKGGKDLLTSEFPIEVYGVVDVKNVKPASGNLETLYSIDCVEQTDGGKPLSDGVFLECNGPTRVRETKAGKYRESHDSTVPGAEPMLFPDDPHSYSGFSYVFELPEVQVPYLIDLEFPDDARRSATIGEIWVDEKTNKAIEGTSYSGKGYETGGMQPFSNQMQHHRVVIWAASKKLILSVISQQMGCRAAVSKITISRFEGDIVPTSKGNSQGGRTFSYWYEEGANWQYLVNARTYHSEPLIRDMEGLDRLVRLCRYFGANGINAYGLAYQSAYWRSNTLDGYEMPTYDMCRLAALVCEKYGVAYTPEVFADQPYMNLVTLPALAEKPDDVRAFSCNGAPTGPQSVPCDMNPLHPVVQKLWIDALGEMADKLRDCPSFRGVTVRADPWLFHGEYIFPSLNWGYGDWTIHKFEKDTGVKVPGNLHDPQRFAQRFEFLTSSLMKEKWVKWRCDGLFDYHQRLRDRIRGNRRDIYFGIAGDFRCDLGFNIPSSMNERVLGCGVNLQRLKTEDGLAIIPSGRWGFRNVGVKEQGIYDDLLDPENIQAGMGVVRSFAAYMNYQEMGYTWPAEKLGVNAAPRKAPYFYCSAAVASGRSSLEKYAVVVAEQDSAVLRDGGNTDVFGDSAIWKPWFAEFCALPALPFSPLDSARDPVAIWFREIRKVDGFASGLYFYAVNREQYPVRIDIALKDSGEITRLGNGETIAPKDGVLSLELQPYELRSFRAPVAAKILSTTVLVPVDKVAVVKNRLAFAQNIANTLTAPGQKIVSEEERSAFLKQLDIAWDAFKKGHLWRTRTALSMAPALRVYEDIAQIPDGQITTNLSGLLKGSPHEGPWLPDRPVLDVSILEKFVPEGTSYTLKASNEINPEWGGSQVLMSVNGLLIVDIEVPVDGIYSLKLGHVAKQVGVTVASIGGSSLGAPVVTKAVNTPETAAFLGLVLKAGKNRLELRREGEFGIYALQLLPQLKPIPNPCWSVIGPFKSFWGLDGVGRTAKMESVAKGLETKYIPEDNVDLNAVFKNDDGQELRWLQKMDSSVGDLNDLVLNMSSRTRSSKENVNYAVTFIDAEADRTVQLHLAVDWWGIAFLNGERITSNISPEFRAASGNADFTSWYPHIGILKLKKGLNTLLVKQHGGRLGSGMAAYITDVPSIMCSPKPNIKK